MDYYKYIEKEDVRDLMRMEALKKQDRIGMIFVTTNGKETGKVLGIITAWDIAGSGL